MYNQAQALPLAGAAGRDAEIARSLGAATSKSLTVGGYELGQRGYGAGLVTEQLDDFIVSLQEDATDLKLMPLLYKQPCAGPVFKYDVITSWGGSSPYARAQPEIARPRADSQVLEQVAEVNKRFGILGQVSFQALMSEMLVDPETQEVRGQTIKLLKDIEQMLYTGDSSLNPLMFDGFRARILKRSPKYNIIDCHGRPLTLDQVDEILAVLKDRPNFGQPNQIHLNYKTHARFNREYVPQGRFDLTDMGGTRGFNTAFDRYKNVVGDVEIVGTSFIQGGDRGLMNPSQNSQLAPQAPAVGAPQVGPATSGQKSNFDQSDEGSYFYFVQAENADGVSPMVQVGTGAQNIEAGDTVNFTITAAQGPRADFFKVFSTKKNQAPVTSGGIITDANAYEIGAVANVTTAMGATPVPFVVDNSRMPACTEGYVFDTRMDTMFWISQMALGKTDLAIMQTAKEFMLNIIGTPALRAPGRVALFTNIGEG